MRTWKKGFIGLQALLVTATMAVASILMVPRYQADADRATISAARSLAGELQQKLDRWFDVTGKFPTSNRHASVLISPRLSKPDFIRDLKIQPDRTGRTVTIMVYLRDGVVANPTGEKQVVYVVGNGLAGDHDVIEWRCGGTGLIPELLPDECRE